MTETAPWQCPTCERPVHTPFCATCGEQPTGPRHLTLRELGHDALQSVSHLDGKILRTLRALVLSPGALTAAYANAGASRSWRRGARGLARVAQTAAMVIAVAALVLGYRFGIFMLTLWWI